LVEFGDYQCPHCAAAQPVIREIKKKFGRDLKFVFRHFPLSNAHPLALPAAIAAEAAARQKKFWPMHELIFENQAVLSEYALLEIAKELGLNMTQFKMDLQDASIPEKIEQHFESGVRSGVNGTPTFFINGVRHSGGYDYASLFRGIEMAMQETA
jgi:protein-disulfide isomerase